MLKQNYTGKTTLCHIGHNLTKSFDLSLIHFNMLNDLKRFPY